jgi:hypothetical protein
MKPYTKRLSLKAIALLLTITVTSVTSVQMVAEAMLAPVSAVQTAPTIDRNADMAVIQKTLESKLLRKKLEAMGLKQSEIDTRLSRMSDQQVHQLASQIRSVNPAGDAVVYVLVVVLLVLLVVYLIKRI